MEYIQFIPFKEYGVYMADITMCSGKKCPKKKSCYRFTAPKNDLYQSYFVNPPIEKGSCEYFWDNEETKKGKCAKPCSSCNCGKSKKKVSKK
jgi:hypothetical protein